MTNIQHKFYAPVFCSILLCLISLNLQAGGSKFTDSQSQKLVFLEGIQSRLMDGDPLYYTDTAKKARYRFNPNEVLPYLLSTGWEIKSIHLNQDGHGDYVYGYAIVEKTK